MILLQKNNLMSYVKMGFIFQVDYPQLLIILLFYL